MKRKMCVMAIAMLMTFPTGQPAGAAPSALQSPSENVAADIVQGAWLMYRHTFVSEDGRVIDNRNGEISHSEGQGYGMLMAVAADDRRSFDSMWRWTQSNLMVREDGLMAWRWDPAQTPHVQDRNNATDGDLLVAWALQRAGDLWQEPSYQAEAIKIARSIGTAATVDTPYGKVLLPGVAGFRTEEQPDGPVVNLAYWIFPAIEDLGRLTADFPADALIETGLKLLREARFGPAQLPADWISLKATPPAPAEAFVPQFGYDAIRVPLYLSWFSRDYPDILQTFADEWKTSPDDAPAAVELNTAARISPMSDPGYRAIVQVVRCSIDNRLSSHGIENFEPTDYYPSTLHILSLMAISERYPSCLTETN